MWYGEINLRDISVKLFLNFDYFFQVFIILKKKNTQLSFLHCYHHGGMVGATFIAAKWLPGGPATMLGIINGIVHVVMYFYYFLTAFKPELKQSIWWKKHITQLQLLQFTVLFFHFLRAAFAEKCDFPTPFLWILLMQDIFFLALFGDFYRKVYMTKKTN